MASRVSPRYMSATLTRYVPGTTGRFSISQAAVLSLDPVTYVTPCHDETEVEQSRSICCFNTNSQFERRIGGQAFRATEGHLDCNSVAGGNQGFNIGLASH